MKIFNLYESILREDEVNSGAQACVARYGKYLFAPQFGTANEPNTDLESSTSQNVFNFTIDSYGKGLSHEFINQVESLKDCMKVYPEVLYPDGPAFRGIHIELGDFLSILPDIKLSGHFRYEYNAKSIIQSWTQTYEVASDFAAASVNQYTTIILKDVLSLYEGIGEQAAIDYIKSLLKDKEKLLTKFVIPVILKHSATPDQFLFKSKYFSLLSGDEDEDEVLRIDNRPIMVGAMIQSEFVGQMMQILPLLAKVLD